MLCCNRHCWPSRALIELFAFVATQDCRTELANWKTVSRWNHQWRGVRNATILERLQLRVRCVDVVASVSVNQAQVMANSCLDGRATKKSSGGWESILSNWRVKVKSKDGLTLRVSQGWIACAATHALDSPPPIAAGNGLHARSRAHRITPRSQRALLPESAGLRLMMETV